jgi:hypothetical protein
VGQATITIVPVWLPVMQDRSSRNNSVKWEASMRNLSLSAFFLLGKRWLSIHLGALDA